MAVDLATARTHALSLLNASSAYATTSDDDAHPLAEITEAILEADAEVCRTIIETPGNGLRRGFITFTSLVPAAGELGVTMPTNLGPISGIEITKTGGGVTPGRPAPLTLLQMWKANSSSTFGATLDNREGYYDIVGDRLYFLGASAKVFHCAFTKGGACQSPDCYYPTVVALALAQLLAKEGDDLTAAAHFQNLAAIGLNSISIGANIVPPVTAYQQGR